MDSRLKTLIKNRSSRIKEAGAHMYHAATGVTDGHELSTSKRHRIKKGLARFRGFRPGEAGVEKMYDVHQSQG